MVGAGNRSASLFDFLDSLLSSGFEDHVSFLINSGKVLSELEGARGVIVCSVEGWDISPLGFFGDFECNSEYFVSCRDVDRSIYLKNTRFHDCSTCKLCGDVDRVCLLPVFFEGKVYALLGLFGSFDSGQLGFLRFLEKILGLFMHFIDIKKELALAREIVIENFSHFEYIADKLRNPLTAIVGYLEVKEDIGYENAFEGIRLQTERIGKVLDNLKKQEKITYGLKKKFEEIF